MWYFYATKPVEQWKLMNWSLLPIWWLSQRKTEWEKSSCIRTRMLFKVQKTGRTDSFIFYKHTPSKRTKCIWPTSYHIQKLTKNESNDWRAKTINLTGKDIGVKSQVFMILWLNFLIILLIDSWLCWVFIAMWASLELQRAGATL